MTAGDDVASVVMQSSEAAAGDRTLLIELYTDYTWPVSFCALRVSRCRTHCPFCAMLYYDFVLQKYAMLFECC